MSQAYTLSFDQISAGDLLHVGGKEANLGEMPQVGSPGPLETAYR
jgi:phosphoenolpyruvate synthase/pyruvate phosphate dikinase